jgi:hypothetical protein
MVTKFQEVAINSNSWPTNRQLRSVSRISILSNEYLCCSYLRAVTVEAAAGQRNTAFHSQQREAPYWSTFTVEMNALPLLFLRTGNGCESRSVVLHATLPTTLTPVGFTYDVELWSVTACRYQNIGRWAVRSVIKERCVVCSIVLLKK